MKTEITVITPAYNAASYLEQCIESVLNQTIPCKMVIVDDASVDDTAAIAKRIAEQYPERIRVLENDRNRGVAVSRNRAIQAADTTYIALLDADDWWTLDKLELQLAAIKRIDADVCYSGRELMCENGTTTGRILHVLENVTYKELLKGNIISCSSVLMKREDALNYPMDHDELHEDYIMWLSMLRDGKRFVGINQPLLKSRLCAGGKSRDKFKAARMTYGVYRYMGIPVWKTWYYLVCYAWNGVRKYAGITKKDRE